MFNRSDKQECGLRGHAAAFALLLMALRAFIPTGYMIASSEDGGGVAVTICSGHGPSTRAFDPLTGKLSDVSPESGDDEPDEHPTSNPPCIFASIAPLSSPVTTLTIEAPAALASMAGELAYDVRPGRGLAAPPPFSTGPPISA